MNLVDEYVRLWQQYRTFRQRDDLMSKDAIRARSDLARVYVAISIEERYQGYSRVAEMLGVGNES